MAANVTWNTTVIEGQEYLVCDIAKLRVPLDFDPNSSVFLAIAAPTGGILNYPVLARGEDGATPDLDTAINFTSLAESDPTAAYASWTETAPNVYKLNLGLHEGLKGDDGDTVLNADDYDNAAPFKILRLASDGETFELVSERVGGSFYPATINNTPSGNPAYTLAVVSIGAQPWPWRPDVSGQTIVTGTGVDVAVNLVARLNGETDGNIVGQAFGLAGLNPPTHVLSDGPPPGLASDYDLVPANTATTVHLRAERRSGTQTFTTAATTTVFKVKVRPEPS